MKNDRAARYGAIFAVVWLVVMVIVDVLLPASISPATLFAIAPLAACAALSARVTAVFGVIAVALVVFDGLLNAPWTPQQWVRVLTVFLVGVAAVVIAEVRVRREERFAHVASIAEAAQRAVLPTLPTSAAGVSVAARYRSAVEDAVVGGDLYDCSLASGRVRFLVGDVRGKGIAAVEQAARVIRAFRQSAATEATLPAVARDMDRYLIPFLGDEDFATALLVDVTVPDQLTLVSCGHPPPLLVRPDGSSELVTVIPGMPLGLGDDFESVTIPWRAGQRLLMYTDGVTEARDEQGEFLPLHDVAPVLSGPTLEAALDDLLERVRDHVPDGQLGDDLAVVLLENIAGSTSVSTAPVAAGATLRS